MRRVLALALGYVGAASAAQAQAIVAGPVATQVTAVVGERLTIPVAVNMTGAPGIDLGSYRARFSWNPALMRLVSATGGTFATPVVNADSAAQGVIRFAAASGQGLSGVPVLADVTLEVVSLASADTFRLAFAEMAAAATFQDLLPFLSVTTGSFCAGTVWGDLDQNGTIQAVDAQIALMHAVGMAVSDTTNGDVDANGVVDTRDALIILSHVIDLDVSSFRVGTLVSGLCQTGAPATLNVLPAALTLAAGDTFRVSAQVRDTAGNLAPGLDLAWMSSDPARASVDSLGVVRALTDGAVTITASVSPTLSGTGAVTVGPRHRWRVDPAGAQGALVELGSDLYPFSTIAQAAAHAAAGDTVSVALGRYAEPLLATKPLVFLGDSGLGGMPVINTPNRPAAELAAPGRHVIRRFAVTESQAGFAVRGDTLEVQSVTFTALRGPALRGVVARATLRGISANGLALFGIGIDSAAVVHLAQVRVSGIEEPDDTTGAAGIFVRADSVFLDTVTVTGISGTAILTRDAERTRLRRVLVEFAEDGVRADSGATLEALDSTIVRNIGEGGGLGGDLDSLRVVGAILEQIRGPAIWLGDAWFGYDQLRVEQTRIERVGNAVVSSYAGGTAVLRQLTIRDVQFDALLPYAATVTVDTVLVERGGGDGLYASAAGQLFVTGSTFATLAGAGIGSALGSGRARITGTAVRDAQVGIDVSNDTLELLADTITDIRGYGIYHAFGRLLSARDVLVRRTASHNLYAYSTAIVDVARSRFDTAGTTTGSGAGIAVYGADTVRVDSSAVSGARQQGILVSDANHALIRHDTLMGNWRFGSALGGVTSTLGAVGLSQVDSALVRHNMIHDNRGNSIGVYFSFAGEFLRVDSNSVRGAWAGVYASGNDSVRGRMEVVDNAFVGRSDGNATGQLYAQSLGVALASGNTFDSIAGVGIYHYYGDSLLVDNNTITGLADGGGTGLGINPNRVGTSLVTGNSITCMGASMGSGLHAYRSTTFASGNTVSGCARGLTALNDGGVTDSVTFTGNRVLGGSMLIGGLVVRGTTVAAFADNVVTGGVLSEGAYAALGTRFVHVPKVTLTGDSVQGGAGRGIVMQWVDTVDIGGTAVSGLGSLYADTTSEAGIWLRNVFGPTYVHGNHVAAGADAGILLSDTARAAALDSNLVVDHGASGLVLRVTTPDTVRGTLNGIRRNQPFGVWIGSVDALLPANDIEGNAFGVFNAAADTVDLRDSYWGDTLGPTCDVGLEYCNVASVGDSIGGFQVGFTFVAVPFAGASVTGAPAGAPPAFALFSTVAPGRTLRARVVPVEPVQPDRPRAALLPPPAPAPASPRREHR